MIRLPQQSLLKQRDSWFVWCAPIFLVLSRLYIVERGWRKPLALRRLYGRSRQGVISVAHAIRTMVASTYNVNAGYCLLVGVSRYLGGRIFPDTYLDINFCPDCSSKTCICKFSSSFPQQHTLYTTQTPAWNKIQTYKSQNIQPIIMQ